jgi:hypothetical protein
MLKNNVDSKFDFIGALEPNSHIVEVVEEHMTAW